MGPALARVEAGSSSLPKQRSCHLQPTPGGADGGGGGGNDNGGRIDGGGDDDDQYIISHLCPRPPLFRLNPPPRWLKHCAIPCSSAEGVTAVTAPLPSSVAKKRDFGGKALARLELPVPPCYYWMLLLSYCTTVLTLLLAAAQRRSQFH